MSSVPAVFTVGSTPSGSVAWTCETARWRDLTTSSESSPYLVLTVIEELPAEDVEVMSSTSGSAVSAPSRGSVTSCSTASGVAPSYEEVTVAWGFSREGKSSCLRAPAPMMPKMMATTEMSAMSARFRGLRNGSENSRGDSLVVCTRRDRLQGDGAP